MEGAKGGKTKPQNPGGGRNNTKGGEKRDREDDQGTSRGETQGEGKRGFGVYRLKKGGKWLTAARGEVL